MAYHSNGNEMAQNHPGDDYSGDERESKSGGDDRPDSDLGNKPVYLLEHLATFTVNQESGIVYPADGMRRLLQLEKTTGIWSQKMQLCLDRQWVLIMDYESGNIIERFPASLIQEPTAFTSNGPMEMYNNILVFIVGGGTGIRSEMHIFQCQSISAVHLVEDLKQLRTGKLVVSRENLSPAVLTGKPAQTSNNNLQSDPYGYQHETDSELGGANDETSSTSSEKYERDVTVLNHCFDDIEKFIARLQHAAAASRELERRRRARKSKKKDPGEGMLTLRTKPPHEKEFIDIFAKFKLSFNLLAKLKAHIHDPNAPELVHFLFTPLALIVDASHDTYYDPNLPARVITPLLTREAINLLINCVTSKETELWRSLGDAWIVPRDQWKGHTGSYHPIFFDGWSPDYPVVDELATETQAHSKRRLDIASGVPQHLHQMYGEDYDYDRSPVGNERPDFSARSDISIDSIERTGERQAGLILPMPVPVPNQKPTTDQSIEDWLGDLQAKGSKIVQVTYPRTANNDKELTVARGEYLEVLDDTRKWWKARNSRGQVAHVPHTIVAPYAYDADVFKNPLYAHQQTFTGPVKNSPEPDRYEDRHSSVNQIPITGQADWIRNKHIVENGTETLTMESNNNVVLRHNQSIIRQSVNRHSEMIILPPPPPPPPLPPPLPVTPTQTWNRTNSRKSTTSILSSPQDDVQEELKHVLLIREKRRTLDIHKTPEIFIQQSSSPTEVQQWLQAKGFSDRVVKQLSELNGNDLFKLKRYQLEDYCGVEEGRRLASQITIQRNVSGYETQRSSELLAMLAKARQKSEMFD